MGSQWPMILTPLTSNSALPLTSTPTSKMPAVHMLEPARQTWPQQQQQQPQNRNQQQHDLQQGPATMLSRQLNAVGM